jgi:oligopeptide/dipeptide ABC transporter ATP-binding protein
MSSGDTAMDATATPPAASAAGAADGPLIELVNVSKHYRASGLTGQAGAPVLAVAGVDLAVPRGATVGIVGESGCGKSTLGRVVVGLEKPTGGEVLMRGKRLTDMGHGERRAARREIQMMFQDPYAALNPRMTLDRIIEEPLRARGGISRNDRRDRVRRLADEVGISAAQLGRYPRELSGGQRQRVGLARALATSPTRALIDAAPNPVPGRATAVTIRGELPSAAAPPSGCRFRTRCPAARDLCAEEEPVPRAFGPAHQAACHFPLKEALPA